MIDDLKLIKRWEGFEPSPYHCPAGIITIGYGSIRTPSGDPILLTTPPIDEPTAALWLNWDCQFRRARIRELVLVPITPQMAAALLSFAYNLGMGALSSSTLLRKLNRGDYEGAAEQFSRWVYAGGRILPGLQYRRADEARLFLSIAEELKAAA